MSIDKTELQLATHSANVAGPEGTLVNTKASVITPVGDTTVQFAVDDQYCIETRKFEGKWDDIVNAIADSFTPGTWVATRAEAGINAQGGVYDADVKQLAAGQGECSITTYKWIDSTPPDGYPDESGEPSEGNSPFAQYYGIQNARYDIPMERYLAQTDDYVTGPPSIYVVSLWEQTKDITAKFAGSYVYPDTTDVIPINPDSKSGIYIKKAIEGKETVIRFWPVVTRTSLWWKECKPFSAPPPEQPGENNQRLGYICKPNKYAGLGKSWLKIQDDLEGEGPVLTRTECWMASEDWDKNMYGWGDDRWPFGGENPTTPAP